jgi:hypothetical protein
MGFVIYKSVEDVENFRTYTEKVAEHFGSDAMAEKYLNGLIDWDGNEICDYCHGKCHCGALDRY